MSKGDARNSQSPQASSVHVGWNNLLQQVVPPSVRHTLRISR
jgi:hypothetical protein